MTLRSGIIIVQAASFVVLALVLLREGVEPKLAAAQALLAIITWLVYA